MDYLYEYQLPIKNRLDNFIIGKYQDSPDIAWFNDFLKKMRPFISSGKLIRGSLVCYTYKICSGKKPSEKVFNAAMAIELIHAGLLIQDDIIDQDKQRRGQPSIHYQYQQKAKSLNFVNLDHYGESMAMCASDIAIFLAFELLIKSCSDAKIIAKLYKEFTQVFTTVCEGQMQDIHLGSFTSSISKKDIFAIMQAKTASYSLALPMVMGSILAESPKNMQQTFKDLGVSAGTIFQIRDDELGALGDSKKLGKPVGADIREGKKTLLYYHLFKQCTDDEHKKLDRIFGNLSARTDEIKYAQDLIRQYKIPNMLVREIKLLENSAFSKIDKLKLSADVKNDLRSLVLFCAARQT